MASITIATLIFIFLQLYILIKPKHNKFLHLFTFTAFTEIFMNLGFLFKLGSLEINYSYISVIITFIYGIIHLPLSKYKKFFPIIPFVIVIILGFLLRSVSSTPIYSTDHTIVADQLFMGGSLVRIRITSYSIIVLFKVMLFLFNLIMLSYFFDKMAFIKIMRNYCTFFKFYIILGIIEFLLNNFVNPTLFRNIILMIFGSSKSIVFIPQFRVGIYTVLLTNKEPSLCMYSLFLCSLGLIWENKLFKKHNHLYILISLLLMITSMALTGLLFVISLIIILLYKYLKKISFYRYVQVFLILVIMIAVFIIVIPSGLKNYYFGRFYNAFSFVKRAIKDPYDPYLFSNYGGSEVFRIYSIINNSYAFSKSPILGVGLGTCTCFSGIVSLLSNLGIVGIICVIHIYKKSFRSMHLKHFKSCTFIIIIMFSLQGGLEDLIASSYIVIWMITMSMIFSPRKTLILEKQPEPVLEQNKQLQMPTKERCLKNGC